MEGKGDMKVEKLAVKAIPQLTHCGLGFDPDYWKVFRAKATTAKLTVSDWQSEQEPGVPFGQEQTCNFLEIQPYHE